MMRDFLSMHSNPIKYRKINILSSYEQHRGGKQRPVSNLKASSAKINIMLHAIPTETGARYALYSQRISDLCLER